MVDKNYCMSSYLAFRNITDDEKDFCEGLHHIIETEPDDKDRIPVYTAKDIDDALTKVFSGLNEKRLGLCLSGGMDSGSLCAYMPGKDAYTFRYLGGDFQKEELARAERYAEYYGLKLHYVDIDWNIVESNVDILMRHRGAPVHSIEPQLYQLSLQARADGVETLVTGIGADTQFGGLDKLMAKDWKFDEFVTRFMYTDPQEVLNEPVDMKYLFEDYRRGEYVDYFGFLKADKECMASYYNAFTAAGMPFVHAYENVKMAAPVDIARIRSGDSKYLIRELFAMKYPDIPVPDKNPMPRPVDAYFKDWEGPTRPEFKKNLDISKFTGNQRWQLWCLERFLKMIDIENQTVWGGVIQFRYCWSVLFSCEDSHEEVAA